MTEEQKELERQKRRERYQRTKASFTTPSRFPNASPAKSTKYNALNKIKKLLPHNDRTTNYILKKLVKASTPSKKKQLFDDLAKFFKFKSKTVNKRNTKDSIAKQLAIDFFENKSVDLPGKDQYSKRLKKQKKVLVEPISELYREFITQNPNVKLSKRLFFACRPRHIMTMKSLKFVQCLCDVCQNAKFLLDSLKSIGCKIPSISAALNSTLCTVLPTSLWQTQCVLRQCKNCSVDKIRVQLHEQCAVKEIVNYKCWDLVSEKLNTGTTKRTALVSKTCSSAELIDLFCSTLFSHSLHVFTYKWQRDQFNNLKENLPGDMALLVLDFSENYACKTQYEVQSAHSYSKQVTIHHVVVYTRCSICNVLKTSYHVFISDDLNHDSAFVYAVLKQTLSLYEKSRFVIFSDNCAAQYKSKVPFRHLSKLSNDFSFERCFFGERHGKSECDSCGGIVKAFLTRASLINTSLQNSSEIVEFLNSKFSLRDINCSHTIRQFHLIKSSIIDRRLKSSSLKTLPGTKKIHSLKVLNNRSVMTRQFSCFCKFCLLDNTHLCSNSMKAFDVVMYDNAKSLDISPSTMELDLSQDALFNDVVLEPVVNQNIDGTFVENEIFECTETQDINNAFIVPDSIFESTETPDTHDAFVTPDSIFESTEAPDLDNASIVHESFSEPTRDLNEAFIGNESLSIENTFFDNSNTERVENIDLQFVKKSNADTHRSPLKDNLMSVPCARKRLFTSPISRNEFFELVYRNFLSCNSFKELKLFCDDIATQIQSFPLTIVAHSIIKKRLNVDKSALKYLPPNKPQGFLPVVTIGDGNCMARAISTIVFGSEDYHKEIRCRIVHELVTHADDYLNPEMVSAGCVLEPSKVIPLIALLSCAHKGEDPKDADACRKIFMRETYQIRRLGVYMGMWQLLAASNILESAIVSVYPKKGSLKLQKCFGRGLVPRNTSYDKPVFVSWTSSRMDMNEEFWVANHVVPLLPFS